MENNDPKRDAELTFVRKVATHFSHRLTKRFDASDNAVLQSHFLIEETLDSLLMALALEPDHLDLEVPFAVKVKILRAFAPMGDDSRWKVVEAINKLRNEIAHPKTSDKKAKAFRRLADYWSQKPKGVKKPKTKNPLATRTGLVSLLLLRFTQ